MVQSQGIASRNNTPNRRPTVALGLVLLALAGAGLAGCGFRPMYGKPEATQTTPVTEDLSSIRVGLIPNRSGQLLRNELELLLDPASSSAARRYTLNVILTEREDSLALERSGFATRANIEMNATFTLIDDATGSPVFAGNSRAISGYNLLDNDFSTLVSRGDANNRVVSQIAHEIRNRLAAHFSRQPQGQSSGQTPGPTPDPAKAPAAGS